MVSRKLAETMQRIIQRSKLRKTWKRRLIFLSCVAVLITVGVLILPAATMEKNPLCGLEEHEHGSDCYAADGQLICQIPEHHHTSECYGQSDPEADVETEADWLQSVSGVTLSDRWGENLLAIALSQVGYKESENNFEWDLEGNKMGYTRYGHWGGNTYGHWNLMFISFCMNYAGIPDEFSPCGTECQSWIDELKTKEYYHDGITVDVEPGDIVFFDYEQDGKSDYAGIVESANLKDDGSLENIRILEGDSNKAVCQNTYGSEDKNIIGFCKISEIQKTYEETLQPQPSEDVSQPQPVEDTSQPQPVEDTSQSQPVEDVSQPEEVVSKLHYEDEKLSADIQLSGLSTPLSSDAELNVSEITVEEPTELFQETLDEKEVEAQQESKVLSQFNMLEFDIVQDGKEIPINEETKADVEITFNEPLFEAGEISDKAEVKLFTVDQQTEEQIDVTSGIQGLEEGITSLTYSSNGIAPVAATLTNSTVSGKYWKQVRNIDELTSGKNYMIVSAEGNFALVNKQKNSQRVVLKPVKGNPDYYEIDNVDSKMKWTYREYNRKFYSGIYPLQIISSPSYNNLTFSKGCWNIKQLDRNGYFAFLSKEDSGFWGSMESSYKSDMLILEEVDVTLTIPEDAKDPEGILTPGSEQKPDYPEYIKTTGEKTGSYQTPEGITGTYASDSSTSQIESQFGMHQPLAGQTDFEAQKEDSGKVLSDKSVIYGADDYNAFNNYTDGMFSVTLSTLAQTYALKTEEVQVPLDVLFILDMSGSMTETDRGQQNNRATILVESVNNAMDNIMSMNPENRACAVGYNSGAKELMQLGRYTPDSSGNYLEYKNNKISLVSETNNFLMCEEGTYTQMGIALGAKMLIDNPETKYTTTVAGETITIPRKPVVILISDGEPTHCTSHYMDVLENPYYGDGVADENNGKGILGYYTILSANYYKRMIGIHYEIPAAMYTIAFGMKENDFSIADPNSSVATNHYRATIMNPTKDNINNLSKATTSSVNNVEIMLQKLLQGDNNAADPVKVGTRFNLIPPGRVHSLVPVNMHNEYRDNYAYADKAYLNNTGSDGLTEAFKSILNIQKISTIEYGFETQSDSPVHITDPIGEGMEIKGDPILRYNGINYQPAKKESQGNTITYTYTGTVDKAPYTKTQVELSKIEVKVSTDADGKQTVSMNVPSELLPLYTVDKTLSFFYEALPVRLIYQVGVSDAGQEKINNTPAGKSCVFYTNRYTKGQNASAVIEPDDLNQYYNKPGWQNTVNKTSNTTGTDEHSIQISGESSKVIQDLGNNGKLTFTKPQVSNHELTIHKVWKDYDGKNKTTDLPQQITVQLYRTYINANGEETKENVGAAVNLTAENNWTKTFLPGELKEVYGRSYKYYVTEQKVNGYNVTYSNDGVSDNTPDTPIVITNKYQYGDYILPQTGGAGTRMFMAGGILLIGLSVSCYIVRQKNSERRKIK